MARTQGEAGGVGGKHSRHPQHIPTTVHVMQPCCAGELFPRLGPLAAQHNAGSHLPTGIRELCHPTLLCAFLSTFPSGRRVPSFNLLWFFSVNKCNSSKAQHLSLTLVISNEKGKKEEAKFSPPCTKKYLASHQCFWHWAMGSHKSGLFYYRKG